MGIVVNEVLRYVRLPFPGKLRNYQVEDIENLAATESCGLYLDLGLGKSVVAAIIGGWKLIHGFFTVVVLCPASLLVQWDEMLNAMGFNTLKYAGTPAKRKTMKFDHDYIVVGFEIFQKDYERFKNLNAYYIVDEATILCNESNMLYRLLNGGIRKKKILDKTTGKLLKMDITQYDKIHKGMALLTATPINKPEDSYGLIKIVNPDAYRSRDHFMACHVAEYDYFGAAKSYLNLAYMQLNLQLNSTLRAAEDHLDMPEIVYNVVPYDLTPAHYEMYQTLLEERLLEFQGKIKVEALQATRLYNWAQRLILNPDVVDPKMVSAGLEYLDTVIYGVKQIIICCKYNMTNEKMMERYEKWGIGGCFGGITRPKQTKAVEEFKAGKLKVLTLHPKSGGFGLNLQICSQVILPEVPNTAREFRQVVGRVYRSGQKNRVIITVPVARKTIQARLLKRIMDRDDITQEVVPTPKSLRQDLFDSK
jgi:superfamily II DNA or RNA helicase